MAIWLASNGFSFKENAQPALGVWHFLYWRNWHKPKETLEQTQAKRPEASVSLPLHQTRKNRGIPMHYSLTDYTMWLLKQALEQEFFLLLKKNASTSTLLLKISTYWLQCLYFYWTSDTLLWKPLTPSYQGTWAMETSVSGYSRVNSWSSWGRRMTGSKSNTIIQKSFLKVYLL